MELSEINRRQIALTDWNLELTALNAEKVGMRRWWRLKKRTRGKCPLTAPSLPLSSFRITQETGKDKGAGE
jgi:hypothetical protein